MKLTFELKFFRPAVFPSLCVFGIFQLKWFSKTENKASIKISFFLYLKRKPHIFSLECFSILILQSKHVNFSRAHNLCMRSTSFICSHANLPTFGLYSSSQRKTNPEQLTCAENWLRVKILDRSNPFAHAGESPCLLLAPELFLSPGASDKLSAVFVFTWLQEAQSSSLWFTIERCAEWGSGCEKNCVPRSQRLYP